jgi:hypothetical protein
MVVFSTSASNMSPSISGPQLLPTQLAEQLIVYVSPLSAFTLSTTSNREMVMLCCCGGVYVVLQFTLLFVTGPVVVAVPPQFVCAVPGVW